MTPSLTETLLSIAGGFRLFFFRVTGFQYLARDAGAAWRSFFAMVVAAPAFALSLGNLQTDMGLEEPSLHFYGVWAMIYVILWFAFPLLLLKISEPQPFAKAVPAYIVAANWVSVPTVYLDLSVDLAGSGGLLPAGLQDGLEFGLLCWFLAVHWWLLRRTLGVTGGQAAALVLLAEGISFACFLWGISRTAMPGLG